MVYRVPRRLCDTRSITLPPLFLASPGHRSFLGAISSRRIESSSRVSHISCIVFVARQHCATVTPGSSSRVTRLRRRGSNEKEGGEKKKKKIDPKMRHTAKSKERKTEPPNTQVKQSRLRGPFEQKCGINQTRANRRCASRTGFSIVVEEKKKQNAAERKQKQAASKRPYFPSPSCEHREWGQNCCRSGEQHDSKLQQLFLNGCGSAAKQRRQNKRVLVYAAEPSAGGVVSAFPKRTVQLGSHASRRGYQNTDAERDRDPRSLAARCTYQTDIHRP